MKTLRLVGLILNCLAFCCLLMLCFIFVKNQSVFGYSFAVVRGNSMYPTIYDGDFLIVKQDTEIECGDTICFVDNKKQIVHRVIGLNGDEIVTQGDNNDIADEPIKMSQCVGKVVYKSSFLGFLYRNINVIFIIIFVFIFYKLKNKTKYDKMKV